MPSPTLSQFFAFTQQRLKCNLNSVFTQAFDLNETDQNTHSLPHAMLYSLLNGGKRVRPMLVFGAAMAVKKQSFCDYKVSHAEDNFANAIEMMHAYSLIHDDLPSMDDDDLRRGQPTCHIQFNEATAILAGDALQTLAFEQALKPCNIPYKSQLDALRCLARASGMEGMVLGQAIDLSSVNKALSLNQLEHMHSLKTGALIETAVTLGALANNASGDQMQALTSYAKHIGLAFQVQDDILDVTSETTVMGKTQGADKELNKPTYVSLLGLNGAQQKAQELRELAHDALQSFTQEAHMLRELADYIVKRNV